MKTLLPVLISSLLFAYLTEKTTSGTYLKNRQTLTNHVFFFFLLLTLALPVGLRKNYNDTGTYIANFRKSIDIFQLLSSGTLNLMDYPGFEIYRSLLRTFTDNYHIFFLIPAFFVQYSFIRVIRRYSESFMLSIGLYICLGTYVFSMAAMKQTIAMAILMWGIPKLAEKKYSQYYLLVFLAFTFHTYALIYAVLPLFSARPWSVRTFVVLIGTMVLVINLESFLTTFLDIASGSGKEISSAEVMDEATVNPMRVAVYAVVPLSTLLFNKFLFSHRYKKAYDILIHMSIFSLAFMLLGTVMGANMFGRMGNYFEFGTICTMAWIINQAFEEMSARLVKLCAIGCFLFYFYFAYAMVLDFDKVYTAVSIFDFLESILLT